MARWIAIIFMLACFESVTVPAASIARGDQSAEEAGLASPSPEPSAEEPVEKSAKAPPGVNSPDDAADAVGDAQASEESTESPFNKVDGQALYTGHDPATEIHPPTTAGQVAGKPAENAGVASSATPQVSLGPAAAFTHSIPLRLPRGVGGFTPQISLDYSSASTAPGPMGQGWRLSIASAIRRAGPGYTKPGESVVVYGHDAAQFESGPGDTWFLDGQRLVLCPSPEEDGCPSGTYRTEYDNFARVEQVEGATAQECMWRVTQPNGDVYEYAAHAMRDRDGGTLFDRISISWLTRIVRRGKTIDSEILLDWNDSGKLESISYGGVDGGPHPFEVAFAYGGSPEDLAVGAFWWSDGRTGCTDTFGSRLTGITVNILTNDDPYPPKRVYSDYELKYGDHDDVQGTAYTSPGVSEVVEWGRRDVGESRDPSGDHMRVHRIEYPLDHVTDAEGWDAAIEMTSSDVALYFGGMLPFAQDVVVSERYPDSEYDPYRHTNWQESSNTVFVDLDADGYMDAIQSNDDHRDPRPPLNQPPLGDDPLRVWLGEPDGSYWKFVEDTDKWHAYIAEALDSIRDMQGNDNMVYLPDALYEVDASEALKLYYRIPRAIDNGIRFVDLNGDDRLDIVAAHARPSYTEDPDNGGVFSGPKSYYWVGIWESVSDPYSPDYDPSDPHFDPSDPSAGYFNGELGSLGAGFAQAMADSNLAVTWMCLTDPHFAGSPGSWTPLWSSLGGLEFADINGDLLTDIVVYRSIRMHWGEPPSGQPDWNFLNLHQRGVFLNTGTSFVRSTDHDLPVYAEGDSWGRPNFLVVQPWGSEGQQDSNPVRISHGSRLLDLNGDGLPELVKMNKALTITAADDDRAVWWFDGFNWKHRSLPGGMSDVSLVQEGRPRQLVKLGSEPAETQEGFHRSVSTGQYMMDVTGDGRPELIKSIEFGYWDRIPRVTDEGGPIPATIDPISRTRLGFHGAGSVALEVGNSPSHRSEWDLPVGCLLTNTTRFLKFPGDIVPYAEDLHQRTIVRPFVDGDGGTRLLDLDGDGTVDLLRYHKACDSPQGTTNPNGEVSAWVQRRVGGKSRHLVSKVTNPLGGSASITYTTKVPTPGGLRTHVTLPRLVLFDNGLDESSGARWTKQQWYTYPAEPIYDRARESYVGVPIIVEEDKFGGESVYRTSVYEVSVDERCRQGQTLKTLVSLAPPAVTGDGLSILTDDTDLHSVNAASLTTAVWADDQDCPDSAAPFFDPPDTVMTWSLDSESSASPYLKQRVALVHDYDDFGRINRVERVVNGRKQWHRELQYVSANADEWIISKPSAIAEYEYNPMMGSYVMRLLKSLYYDDQPSSVPMTSGLRTKLEERGFHRERPGGTPQMKGPRTTLTAYSPEGLVVETTDAEQFTTSAVSSPALLGIYSGSDHWLIDYPHLAYNSFVQEVDAQTNHTSQNAVYDGYGNVVESRQLGVDGAHTPIPTAYSYNKFHERVSTRVGHESPSPLSEYVPGEAVDSDGTWSNYPALAKKTVILPGRSRVVEATRTVAVGADDLPVWKYRESWLDGFGRPYQVLQTAMADTTRSETWIQANPDPILYLESLDCTWENFIESGMRYDRHGLVYEALVPRLVAGTLTTMTHQWGGITGGSLDPFLLELDTPFSIIGIPDNVTRSDPSGVPDAPDWNSARTITQRDALGRVNLVTVPGGYTTDYDYELVNDPVDGPMWMTKETRVNGSKPRTTYSYMDADGNLIRVTQCNTASASNPDAVDPNVWTTRYAYDSRGNRTHVHFSDGTSVTRRFYDGFDQLIGLKDPDLTNCDLGTIDDLNSGCAIRYDYDDVGNLTQEDSPTYQLADSDAYRTSTTYDGLGRPLTASTANFGAGSPFQVTTRTYDRGIEWGAQSNYGKGSLVRADAQLTLDGTTTLVRTDYRYDPSGRALEMRREFHVNGALADQGSQLNLLGPSSELLAVSATSRNTTFTDSMRYDGYGRLVLTEDEQDAPVFSGATYSEWGGISTYVLGDSLVVNRFYNDGADPMVPAGDLRLNRISALVGYASPVGVFVETYGYDALGQVKSIGGDADFGPQYFTYDYVGRLTEFKHDDFVVEEYGYDQLGRRTLLRQHSIEQDPDPDPGDPPIINGGSLEGLEGGGLEGGDPMAPAGGGGGGPTIITTEDYYGYRLACSSDEPLHAPVVITRGAVATCANASRTRDYDAQGRLTNASAGTQNLLQVEYDAYGQVVKAQVGATSAKRYVRDHVGAVVAVATSVDTVTTILDRLDLESGELAYYSNALGNRVSRRTATDVSYFVHDHLGSTAAQVNGELILELHTRYRPFGGVWVTEGTASADRYAYEGMRDESADLLDFNARFYQSGRGLFLQPDIIVPNYAEPQSLNRYAFELSSPLTYMDPTGHEAVIASAGALYIGTLVVVSVAVLAAGDAGVGEALNEGRLTANEAVWEFIDTVKGWFASEEGSDAGEQGESGDAGASEGNATGPLDHLGDGASPGRETTGKTKQWEKKGGADKAREDFDRIPGQSQKSQDGKVDVKVLPDGTRVSLRPKVGDKPVTIDVHKPNGRKIKYRYPGS